MVAFTFVVKKDGSSWSAKRIAEEEEPQLTAEADDTYRCFSKLLVLNWREINVKSISVIVHTYLMTQLPYVGSCGTCFLVPIDIRKLKLIMINMLMFVVLTLPACKRSCYSWHLPRPAALSGCPSAQSPPRLLYIRCAPTRIQVLQPGWRQELLLEFKGPGHHIYIYMPKQFGSQ